MLTEVSNTPRPQAEIMNVQTRLLDNISEFLLMLQNGCLSLKRSGRLPLLKTFLYRIGR